MNSSDYFLVKFPAHDLFSWFAKKGDVANREFSFTLDNGAYLRYLSFSDSNEFKEAIQRLKPAKIDVGAIYNVRPSERKSFNPNFFNAVKKELVFDIDMNDYDKFRTCCKGKTVCKLCWKFCAFAASLIQSTLKEDFNLSEILWVFSGRRGMHGWVSDPSVVTLKHGHRNSLLSYMDIPTANDGTKRKSLGQANHHFVKRLLSLANSRFQEIVIRDQNSFQSGEFREYLYGLLPREGNHIASIISEDIRNDVKGVLERAANLDSAESWSLLNAVISRYAKQSDVDARLAEEIIITIMLPNLDVNVTAQVGHLIKAPFSVHPDTGKVSVPIEFDAIWDFDPSQVPTAETFQLSNYPECFYTDKHGKMVDQESLHVSA